MTQNNRKHDQAELIFKLGQLLGPLLTMAENPDAFDDDERNRILARLTAEYPVMSEAIKSFTVGEPGHDYYRQYSVAYGLLHQLAMSTFDGSTRYREWANYFELQIRDIILSIPVPVDSTIYEARTPFSTYCFVKDLCSTAKDQIVWLDRYFDQTLFYRYFTDTLSTAVITLVTLPLSHQKSKKDKARYAEFLEMSRLFAQQRGPTRYRLVVKSGFHDRWLRCDDKMFTLGGSIKDLSKDLSKPFTIARLDSKSDNAKQFDDAISLGTELFGPNQTVHP